MCNEELKLSFKKLIDLYRARFHKLLEAVSTKAKI